MSAQSSTQFAGFDDFIEVFRAGTHTDASGQTRAFTESDLDQIVANHNAEHPAPAVVGHPKDNDPAYGWTEGLKRVGDRLLAKFHQVAPAFAQAVKDGRFRNRSIKISQGDNGWKLVHVGFLGAAAPAVEGLKPIAFSQADTGPVFEFSQPTQEPSVPEATFTQADVDAAAQRARDEARAAAATAAETSAARIRELEYAQRIGAAQAEVRGHVDAGRLLPAQAHGAAEFLAGLQDGDADFEFAAADGQKGKQKRAAWFSAFLASLPVQVKPGAAKADADPASAAAAQFTAPPGYAVDPARAQIHAKALAYMAEHKSTDYQAAVRAVESAG